MKKVRFLVDCVLYAVALPAFACFVLFILVTRQSNQFANVSVALATVNLLSDTAFIAVSLVMGILGTRMCPKMLIGAIGTLSWTLWSIMTLDAHEIWVLEIVVAAVFTDLMLLSYENWRSVLEKRLPSE